ncbi:MAG: hypothetical protein HYY30_12715 [Chloroflexi bacterium]|nr:hypothetical protein [Chloroflexota bacterium]
MPRSRWVILILVAILLLLGLASLDQGATWDGVDTTVVGGFAIEAGRESWTPLFNLQGDALLFAFAISGAIGGFAAGYYWRELFGGNGAPSRLGREPSSKEARRDV